MRSQQATLWAGALWQLPEHRNSPAPSAGSVLVRLLRPPTLVPPVADGQVKCLLVAGRWQGLRNVRDHYSHR